MQFRRAARLAAVFGLAFASGLYAQRGGAVRSGYGVPASNLGAVRSGPVGPARAPGSSVPFTRSAVTPGLGLGGQPYPIRTDIPTPPGLNAPASAYTGILPGAYKPPVNVYGHNNRYFPGFVASPLFFPTYWDTGFSSFPSYDNSIPPVDPNAQAVAESQEVLAQQIQQLTTEVQQMRNSNNQQPPMPSAPAPVASAAPESRPPAPPITLILRDGQQLSVENYAVMNQMFWNFSKRPAQKIPISDIDIAASTKATEANGGEFPPLGSSR